MSKYIINFQRCLSSGMCPAGVTSFKTGSPACTPQDWDVWTDILLSEHIWSFRGVDLQYHKELQIKLAQWGLLVAEEYATAVFNELPEDQSISSGIMIIRNLLSHGEVVNVDKTLKAISDVKYKVKTSGAIMAERATYATIKLFLSKNFRDVLKYAESIALRAEQLELDTTVMSQKLSEIINSD